MEVRNLGSFTEAYTPRYIHYGTLNQQALSTGWVLGQGKNLHHHRWWRLSRVSHRSNLSLDFLALPAISYASTSCEFFVVARHCLLRPLRTHSTWSLRYHWLGDQPLLPLLLRLTLLPIFTVDGTAEALSFPPFQWNGRAIHLLTDSSFAGVFLLISAHHRALCPTPNKLLALKPNRISSTSKGSSHRE